MASTPAGFAETLLRTIRTSALYPSGHPARKQVIERFHETVSRLAVGPGALCVAVGPDGLTVQGTPVDSAEGHELASRLAAGGIVWLELLRDITPEELDGLCPLLGLDFENLRLDDDLVTLLWERRWPHVRWQAAEVPTPVVDSDEGRGFSSLVPDEVPTQPLFPADWPYNEFALTDTERAALTEAAAQEMEDPSPTTLAEFVCQLIGLAPPTAEIDAELETLAEIVERCLREGRFGDARQVLAMLDQTFEATPGVTDERRRAVATCRARFATAEGVGLVLEPMDEKKWDDPEAVVAYFASLPPAAIPHLLDALGRLVHPESRELMRAALADHLREDLSYVEKRIPSLEGDQLIDVVRLLGQVGSREAVPILKDVVRLPSPAVRHAVVGALRSIGGGHARVILAQALWDPDEDVRCAAAEALPAIGRREALELLFKAMLKSDFKNRSPRERRTFFVAVGATNLPEVLPFLRKLLRGNHWWELKRRSRDREFAAAALSVMTHPEALALRAELEASGPAAVRRSLGGEEEA
jgi:hypothetical protein